MLKSLITALFTGKIGKIFRMKNIFVFLLKWIFKQRKTYVLGDNSDDKKFDLKKTFNAIKVSI